MTGSPRLSITSEATRNEDWVKTMAWDVRNDDGSPVSDLKSLARTLGMSEGEAADELLNSAAASAAPKSLVDEARKAIAEGGAGTEGGFGTLEWEDGQGEPVDTEGKALPPWLADKVKKGGKDGSADTGSSTRKVTIASGAYVSWSGGKGRVEMVVTNGKVPGVESDLTGSKDEPVAKVRVWKDQSGTMVQTGERVAVKASSLKTTAPFGGPAKKELLPEDQLVAALAGFEGDTPPHPTAVKTVYARGLKSHPGELLTELSPEEWALGRVGAFLRKSAGEEIEDYTRDDDLLP
jgi:hypothetical protein